jgi:hypothetical protein
MDFNIIEEEFFNESKENDPKISSLTGNCFDRHSSIPPSNEGMTIIQDNACDPSANNSPFDATLDSKRCYVVVESSYFTVPSDMQV